ncbi:MAG: DUF2325 domain-containing protein [Cocleimonas sp.]|nr:DUF2325 domain-containing protein [Cocleimonas sp.]
MCQLTPSPVNQANFSPLPIANMSKKSTSRLKFWDIQSRYHCSALGTCLTLQELRQIAKKARITGISTWSDYDMHVSFLHTLDVKCHISTLVNKALDKKYKLIIQQISKTKNEQDRIEIWNKAVVTGNVTGAFWALLTHPATTENTLFQIYGKVHMLSHLSGASARIDMKEFYSLEQHNKRLADKIKQKEESNSKKLQKIESQLFQANAQLSNAFKKIKTLELAQKELDAIKNKPFVENLQHQLKQCTIELNNVNENNQRSAKSAIKWKQYAIREQLEKQQLQQQLNKFVKEKKSTENHLINLPNNQEDKVENCHTCINTNSDLCGRCVLYVGGRNSQCSHFRQLVEQQNGQFIHHDGGREDSYQKLASIVTKADVVFCPLDCVSHTAMNLVKRHCQNNTKQLVYIPHASLSAFSKGLTEIDS